MTTKKEWRHFLIEKLQKSVLLPENIKEENQVLAHFFQSDSYQQAQTIAVTLSSGFEFNTRPLIERAWADGKMIFIPKTLPERQMSFHHYQSDMKLEKSAFGIMEPQAKQAKIEKNKLDLIVVPGLGFDLETGYRIGFGGGFYDRYLADYLGETVAFVRDIQKVHHLSEVVEQTDIPVKKLFFVEN